MTMVDLWRLEAGDSVRKGLTPHFDPVGNSDEDEEVEGVKEAGALGSGAGGVGFPTPFRLQGAGPGRTSGASVGVGAATPGFGFRTGPGPYPSPMSALGAGSPFDTPGGALTASALRPSTATRPGLSLGLGLGLDRQQQHSSQHLTLHASEPSLVPDAQHVGALQPYQEHKGPSPPPAPVLPGFGGLGVSSFGAGLQSPPPALFSRFSRTSMAAHGGGARGARASVAGVPAPAVPAPSALPQAPGGLLGQSWLSSETFQSPTTDVFRGAAGADGRARRMSRMPGQR